VHGNGSASEHIPQLLTNLLTGTEDCSVCIDGLSVLHPSSAKVLVTPCGHLFHADCIKMWLNSSDVCPLCKRLVSLEMMRTVTPSPSTSCIYTRFRITHEHSCHQSRARLFKSRKQQLPSKMTDLITKISDILHLDPSAKIAVFSPRGGLGFDISTWLKQRYIPTKIIYYLTDKVDITRHIKAWSEPNGIYPVIVVAGERMPINVDLTPATHVMCLNIEHPSEFLESIATCHRFGQRSPLNVHLFAASDTIDEAYLLGLFDSILSHVDGTKILSGMQAARNSGPNQNYTVGGILLRPILACKIEKRTLGSKSQLMSIVNNRAGLDFIHCDTWGNS
jgi:hypothetical protein